MKSVYVSIVGNRDPYDLTRNQSGDGAALSLYKSLTGQEGLRFQEALLIYTPDAETKPGEPTYAERLDLLSEELRTLQPDLAVVSLPIHGAPNRAEPMFQALIQVLRPHLNPGQQWHINASSGTPAMLMSLQILQASQWFSPVQVQMWQSVDPSHLDETATPVDHYFKSRMPLFAEALKLQEVFSALKRFDFAHALHSLANFSNLEISSRESKIPVLRMVIQALIYAEHKDFDLALGWIDKAEKSLDLPAIKELRLHFSEMRAKNLDHMAMEAWARVNRLIANREVLESVIWIQIFAEVLTKLILELHNIAGDKVRRTDIPNFAQVCANMGIVEPKLYIAIDSHNNRVKFFKALQYLPAEKADMLDADSNPDLEYLRQVRNKIVHEGAKANPEDLKKVKKVADELLDVYPFQQQGLIPDQIPLSAKNLRDLAKQLQEWLG